MSENVYPRVLIAGVSSGVGKTTISLAVMAALVKRGLKVQGFKVGPDFIDPGYYEMVTGRPGRNLDSWMVGQENTKSCFLHASMGTDISVIEGVMGLYDGKDGLDLGSSAEIAKLIECPVILVIDGAKIGGSAGAIALGYVKYDESLNIAGFIVNNVGSNRHESMIRTAIEKATGLPVFGCVKRNARIQISERHLGLLTQIEKGNDTEFADLLAEIAVEYIDVDGLLKLARLSSKPLLCRNDMFRQTDSLAKVRIGVAYDKAFSFYYYDNFDLLEAAGAKIIFFSPIKDEQIPEGIDGLYIGGGYPEVYANDLQQNKEISLAIRKAIEDGMPVYAECGGLMYLAKALEDFDGMSFEMCGAFPVECKMQKRPTLRYREVVAISNSVVAIEGDILKGHEFHYSSIKNIISNIIKPAYRLENGLTEGLIYKNALATYIHLNFASKPGIADRFVEMCQKGKVLV